MSQLYFINEHPDANVGLNVIRKLYKLAGLRPSTYLELGFEW